MNATAVNAAISLATILFQNVTSHMSTISSMNASSTELTGELSASYNPSAMDKFIEENIAYFDIGLYILYTIVFLFGICGNSLVIFVLISSICINANNKFVDRNENANHLNSNNRARKFTLDHENSLRLLVKTKKDMVPNAHQTTDNEEANAGGNNLNEIRLIRGRSMRNNNNQHNQSTNFKTMFQRFLKEKFTVTNFYLLNLAISDFTYLTLIPILLCTMYFSRWIFGSFICKCYITLVYLCQCSSIFILVVMSIDRYLSVVYPLKVASFRTDRRARITILIGWLLSFLFVSPIPIYTTLQNHTCSIIWPDSWNFNTSTPITQFIDKYMTPLHAFTIYTLLLNYVIPVSVIVILYTRILTSLNQKSKLNRMKMSESKKKSHKRISKMVLIIIICYIISWTPYWTSQLTYYIYFILNENQPLSLTLLAHIAQFIAYMSSALNPWIYSYMSEVFRNELKLVFKNVCCCFRCIDYLFDRTKKTSTQKVPKNTKSTNSTSNASSKQQNHTKTPSVQTPVTDNFKLNNKEPKNEANEPTEAQPKLASPGVLSQANNCSKENIEMFENLLTNINSLDVNETASSTKKKRSTSEHTSSTAPKGSNSSTTPTTIGNYKFEIKFHGFKLNNLLDQKSKNSK